MKLKSLYEYYREYFDFPKSSNRYYGRAVGEMSRLTREVMKTKSTETLHSYLQGKYCNSITKNMIKKLLWLSINCYADPLKEIDYFYTLIDIDKNLINSRHRGIQIPFECGIDYRNKKIIILVYGSNYNMAMEISVLKGLINEFNLSNKIPIVISSAAYWNLSKGIIDEVDFDILKPAERLSLISAANRII
jgi:hypothetical protein